MKLPSVNRNNIPVLITLVFVLVFGAFYFFMYIPNTEKGLQQQRFRSLQNIDKNIHSKIDNSVALMSNLLKDTVNTAYIEYLNAQSREHFTLLLPGNHPDGIVVRNITDSSYSIIVNKQERQITLLLTKRNIAAKDTAEYQMAMKWSFEQFLEFLLPQNVFDQYIVFSDGEVVYETFPSGINYLKDSLLDKENGVVTSVVRTLTVSGTGYKLFSLPVSFTAANEWVITGLLSNNRYLQEKNQLPANAILLLITILLVIIVIFPWVKLYQMGNKNRLTVIDGISTIMVSMLLMSLLFFTFFKYNVPLRPKNSPNAKDTLARQIATAFQNEIDTAYRKVRSFDDALGQHMKLFSDNITNLNDSDKIKLHNPPADSTRLIHNSLKALQAIATTINLYQVFWLDRNGTETVNWTTEGMNTPHGNFKARDYFKKIVQKKEYLLHNDTAQRFYLDQLVSWTNGSFRTVISVRSVVPGLVAAMSFNMRSVYKPVLPEGYQFAITTNTGKVLYHSDPARNLNENLVTEFSEKDNLISCLQARTDGLFKTKYFSREYVVTVKPVEKLPYFIIIFSDTSYKETRDMEIYSFTFSMLLLFFAFLILQLFVVFLVSSKRSFFKKQLFDTSWIGPKISSYSEYNLAALTNVIITLLALSFFPFSTFLTYLFILLFSVTLISIFLTSLFARRYKNSEQADNYTFKVNARRWLVVFATIIDVAAVRTLDGSSLIVLAIYELLAIILAWLMYAKGNFILIAIYKRAGKRFLAGWNYARSFSLMALTRLIFTSGIPVVFFYIASYDYEQNIGIRYRQLQYANKLLDSLSDKQIDGIRARGNFVNGFYYDGAFIKDVRVEELTAPVQYSREENITADILQFFRVKITGKAVDEEKFFTAHAADTLFFYNPLLKDACKKDSATITYRQTGINGKYLAITSAMLNYRLPSVFSASSFNGFLFWLLLFLAFIVFYFIIYNIISKLFCISLPDLSEWKELDDKIIGSSRVNNLLFIIGLPGSGKLSVIKEKIQKGEITDEKVPLVFDEDDDSKGNVFIADLINIPDYGNDRESNAEWMAFKTKAFNQKNRLVIVNHFEYNIEDAVTNRIKLNFLQALMLENRCKIIILSTIHPVAFLDSVMDQSVEEGDKSAPGQDLERWHVLFGHYRIIIFPLQQSPQIKIDSSWKAIYKETQQTHFLAKIQEYAIERANDLTANQKEVDADEFAFKLQVTAHYFYMYMWQSLTKEEKFLLYDLAEDNLVNSFDDYNLNMLLAKGIIIRPDGTLKLFNKGFRNFILTAIGNSEAMKIKQNIADNGNWNRLKNPLLIVILAIIVFLMTSQQEAYSRLITYVAALTTGIPALLKLLSVFDKQQPKE